MRYQHVVGCKGKQPPHGGFRQGLELALIMIPIRIAEALALTRFLPGQLYGVKPTETLTFFAFLLTLISIASLACNFTRPKFMI